jgi:hypothetical protein
MNKYLRRLKVEKSETPLSDTLPKSPKYNSEQRTEHAATNYDDFDSAQHRHVSPNEGIPHPVYGHDCFSPIRLPHPAILNGGRPR